MRSFIFFLVLMLGFNIQAATPPNQQTVDGWVAIALALSDKQIETEPEGRWVCEHIPVFDKPFTSRGKTQQEATHRAALKCIRDKCANMPNILAEAHKELAGISDEELSRLMKGLAHTPEEIERALKNRKNPNQEYMQRTSTCTGGSPLLRAFTVDSCFAIPFQCAKK